MANKRWTDAEDAIVVSLYAQGWQAVQAQIPHRTEKAIVARAFVLDVTKSLEPEGCWVLPEMNLTEQLDCLRLRKWAGPVDRERPLVARLAA